MKRVGRSLPEEDSLPQFVSGTLDDHCANLITTQRKLARLGVELNNDIVIAVLLNGLPSQYDY